MFRRYLWLAAVVPALVMATSVQADWDGPDYPNPGDPADPAKFYQLPDETLTGPTPNGLDVLATFPKILADDFLCVSPGPITDIHLWGSWLNDNVYPGARFKLSIHADIPAGTGGVAYSRPGQLLWSRVFGPGYYKPRLYRTVPGERFYDPNTDTIIGTDSQIWQYNFVNIVKPFVQTGTQSNPVIYWLDVQVDTGGSGFKFGWKSADPAKPPVPPFPGNPFNDDAVYGDTNVFGGEPFPQFPLGQVWKDMHFPAGHAYAGQSINLSFAITSFTPPIPTVSQWGMIVMTLLLLTAATIIFARRRAAAMRTT
jgi:hypothetical protein